MARAALLLLPLSLLLALSQAANGYRFVGCYRDSGHRDLPVRASAGSMSIGKCSQQCSSRHYMFFGLQAGNECWCGNSFGRYGAKPNGECRDRCSGENTEICGAGWRNSIYTTDHVSGLHYLGCYADSSTRDLPVLGGSGSMTIHSCSNICRSRGFAYFGVQNSNECWCGNSYARHGARPESECNMHCRGDNKILCGAGWRNSVYATGLRPRRSYSPGRPIRDNMAAKVRSMSTPIPGGVFCSHCLVASFQLQKADFRSDNFPVSELHTRLAHYPEAARKKLQMLQFGANAKTTFEDHRFHIGLGHATRSTYFGMAERVNNRVHLGMVRADIAATLVHKFNEFRRRVCKKILFWNKCRDHTVRERRGYHFSEVQNVKAALESETMRVFKQNLANIHV